MYEHYPLGIPDFAPYATEIQRSLNDAIKWSANAINHIGFLDKWSGECKASKKRQSSKTTDRWIFGKTAAAFIFFIALSVSISGSLAPVLADLFAETLSRTSGFGDELTELSAYLASQGIYV